MRYRVVAVGNPRRGFVRRGCDHYAERLERYAKLERIAVKEARGDSDEVRRAEGAALLAHAEGRIVALDERGAAFGSAALAERVSALELRGESRLTLLIGGAEGLPDAVRAAAHETWRLSNLTLPHELAQLLLLEQLYRLETIRAGHPYHRG